MSKTPVVATLVVLVGFVAYLIGATFPLRPAAAPDAAPVVAREDAAPRAARSDDATAALLRETRAANRELREAVALLTSALAEIRSAPKPPADAAPAVVSDQQWATRLRAREPDVVMDRVCGLRERLLTKALTLDVAAKAPMGQLIGGTAQDAADFSARHAAMTKAYQETADRCRVADKELDAVRTMEDMARWWTRNDGLVER